MEKDSNLSNQYFDSVPSTSLEGIDDEKFDFNTIETLPINEIDEYKIEEQEEPQTSNASISTVASQGPKDSQSTNNASDDGTLETDVKQEDAPAQEIVDNDSVLSEIKNINDEIISLQNKLNEIDNSEPGTANKSIASQDVTNTQPPAINSPLEQQDNDIIEVSPIQNQELLNTNLNASDIFNSETLVNSDEITNKIIELNNKKEELVKKIVENEIKNISKNSKNTFNDYGKVSIDNFTPNFALLDEDQQESINNAVATESALGKTPKIVTDSKGVPAVISEDQIDLKTAIDQHGGVESAVSDSVNNQAFFNSDINNFSENPNIFNNLNNMKNIEATENIDGFVQSSIPDSFNAVAENSKATLNAILDISNQFGSIVNVLNKGFANVSNSMKSVGSSKNYNQTVYNNSNKQQSVSMASRNKETITSNPIPTNLKSDFPLSKDFPSGFDLSSLGGSNLMR